MPWPIVPAPSTATRPIGRAEAVLLFSSEFLLNVLSQNVAEPRKVDPNSGHGIGWGLPGSTNSYANSYTIRATENANRFPAIRHAAVSEPGAGSDRPGYAGVPPASCRGSLIVD